MVNRPREGESGAAGLWLTDPERVNHLKDLCVHLGELNCEKWI